MTSTALTGASGYLFWIIAARMYPAQDVGLASALIGTMMLAATLANLGIGPTLIQVLPRRQSGDAWSLTLNAVLFTGLLSSLLSGSIAVIALPLVTPKFAMVLSHGEYPLALIAGVPMLTLAALLDATFTAERAAGNMLVRTAAFALLRIILLVIPIVLGMAGGLVISVAWILAAGGSVITGALLIPRLRRAYCVTRRGLLRQIRSMLALVAGNQFISLGALAPVYLMPILVVARLSFAQNAYFYTSWQVGSLFFMVSPSVAAALLAEGASTPGNLFRAVRSSLMITAALLCPAMLAAVLGGHLILSVFGLSYSTYGYTVLVVLVISAIPDAITNIYIAVLRVQRQFAWAAVLNLGMAAVAVVGAWYLLPQLGIVGAGLAWLIAQTSGTLLVAGRLLVAHLSAQVDQGPATAVETVAPKRILLIVDPCSAGEALRMAPCVSMIRRQHPHAHITLVANPDALQGLERMDALDRVVKSKLYIYRPYSRLHVRMCQAWRWLELVWQLGFGYDLVITFFWGGILQHALGSVVGRSGSRFGYTSYPKALSRWLLSSYIGAFDRSESSRSQHSALLRAAGIEPDETAPPYINYTDDDKAAVAHLLDEHGLADGAPFIVLHPGSDWACQQWLQERWAELADALVARYDAAIVFTGSANEAGYVEQIQRRMKASSVSLVGQTTLAQVAALLARSVLCICVDVAVFELTQAVGTPTVVLAGPSRPDTGVFGARRPIVIRPMSDALAARIAACQAAHNARNVRNCWNYQCDMAGLRQTSVGDVLQAVERQLPTALPVSSREADEMTPTARPGAPEAHPLLEATFSAFTRANIRWCLLRGEADLRNPGADDVDLLIARDDLARARSVLKAHQYVELPSWGRGSHTFFIGFHPATETWITLDIVTELTYGPYLNLPTYAAAGCLARRQSTGAHYLLAPDDGFWTLLLHCLLDKGFFAPHRSARLQELAGAAHTDGTLARLVTSACPRSWDAAQLIECVDRGDWETLTQLAPMIARGWRRREPMKARWWATINRAGQLLEIPLVRLRRPGVSIALLGPDGAGKSTLAAEISRRFYFPVRSVYMGLWKGDRPRASAKPHLVGLWIARRGMEIAGRMPTAWGRYLVARYHQMLGRVVIFDRYVYDALMSSHEPMGWLKRLYMWLLGHACPPPDLVLVLDAPGEVMFARKGEGSPEALEAQRQSLLALRDRIPRFLVVDAAQGEAAVRAEVLDRIWSEYRDRWSAA